MRQLAALGRVLCLAAGLGGCSYVPFLENDPEVPVGTIGYVKGFYGGVAADEPQAALAGRDVLTSGGSAADAAVAMYFTLAVTMPSAAGLGGGGICLVRNPDEESVETLDFLGQPSSGPGRRVMVPGNPRGIFALHAKFGKFDWRELLRPAENLARFGSTISRAFATELRDGRSVLAGADAGPFVDAGGQIVNEGVRVVQPDLAATLSQLRARGGAIIYTGDSGRRFADNVQRMGFGLTYRDLTAALPIWRATLRVPFLKHTSLHFPMPRTPAGTLGAKMAAMLYAGGNLTDTTGGERAHLLAEAIQRAAADGAAGFHTVTSEREIIQKKKAHKKLKVTHTQLNDDYAQRLMVGYRADRLTELATSGQQNTVPGNPGGSTSFTVLDNNGGVVACAFTMNGPFGLGRVVPGTGMFLAPYPENHAARDLSLGAVIADRDFGNIVYLAGSASGGVASQAVVTALGMSVAMDSATRVDDAVATKDRVYRDLAGHVTYVENGASPAVSDGLKQRGHRVVAVPELARVNMAFCPNGLPAEVSLCRIVTDPRGFGYASVSD